MAPHSSTLAWKIPWMEEPGRLQSMGLLRVGHDWATSLSFFTCMHWRRKWQPTPVFLPGESQGQGSLVGCRLWDHTESDTTEVTAAAVPTAIKYSLIVALPLVLREGWQGYQRSQRDSPPLSILDMEQPCFYVRKLRLAWMGQRGAYQKKKKSSWASLVYCLPASTGDTGSIPDLGRCHMTLSSWAHVPQL